MKMFTKELICNSNEELVQMEDWDVLALHSFCIFNLGENKVSLVLNKSDFELSLEAGEGFEVDNIEVNSCVCLTDGATLKFSGWY